MFTLAMVYHFLAYSESATIGHNDQLYKFIKLQPLLISVIMQSGSAKVLMLPVLSADNITTQNGQTIYPLLLTFWIPLLPLNLYALLVTASTCEFNVQNQYGKLMLNNDDFVTAVTYRSVCCVLLSE